MGRGGNHNKGERQVRGWRRSIRGCTKKLLWDKNEEIRETENDKEKKNKEQKQLNNEKKPLHWMERKEERDRGGIQLNDNDLFLPLFRSVWLLTIESFSTNDESDYEHEIWKKAVKSMRNVSNLVRRTRRTTSLKWKVVVGKRVGLPTEKAEKVDLIYFAGFKCALEDCYKHQQIDIHSRFVLKIGYGLELMTPL